MIRRALIRQVGQLKERVYKHFSQLHHIEHLEGPQVLVLAPHPDDETFGCGGTLLRHRAMGHQVTIVFLTDGRLGIPGVLPAAAAEIRREEALRATALLGIQASDLHFWGLPDGALQAESSSVDRLRRLIGVLRPDLVYLPSFLDQHPDHFQANVMLKAALQAPVLISAYEIWTPLVPNRLVDISEVMPQKTAAMQAYQSQLSALPYAEAMSGLNAYRAGTYAKQRMRYAEAFLCTQSTTYFNLF